MSHKFYKFGTIDEVEHFLNGGIRGSGSKLDGKVVYGLHNLTLVFNTPAGTVTFSDASNAGLSLVDIKTQIETDVAALKVKFRDGHLWIIDDDVSGPVVLDATGTANTKFGFSDTTDSAGVVYATFGGTAPAVAFINDAPFDNGWVVGVVPS